MALISFEDIQKISIFCFMHKGVAQQLSLPHPSPLFKFGYNPSLIDGILNVLPYELASYMGYEKSKKWQLEHAD